MNICLAMQHRHVDFIPLAALYLKAYLVQARGHDSASIDIAEFEQTATPDAIVDRILSTRPEIVGLSCYVWNIKTLGEVSRRIRERRPDVRIVLGGPEVGPVAAAVMRAHPQVDVIVKSEGEIPFAELVRCWEGGGDASAVAGTCARRDGEVVDNPEAAVLKDLNTLSSPHLAHYVDYTGRIICIETQRGCVFRCNFCFYNKDYSIRNRRFDLDRVKEEVGYWLERDVHQIYLMDPVFNLYADRAKEICRFIAERNHRRIGIHAEVWAEFIDDELAGLMRDAHFTFLEVGLQTTDSDVLKTVERRLKLQKFIDGIGFLKQYELPFELQLIYGLPGETVNTFRTSLDFAVSLDPPELAVFPLMVLPGTELWRKAAGFKLEFEPEPPYHVTSHYSMSADDIAYGWKIHRALSFLGDPKTFRTLSREKGLRFADIVDAWVAWEHAGDETEPRLDKVRRFLSRFCGERGIPEAFYQGMAALEFTPPPAAAPTPAGRSTAAAALLSA